MTAVTKQVKTLNKTSKNKQSIPQPLSSIPFSTVVEQNRQIMGLSKDNNNQAIITFDEFNRHFEYKDDNLYHILFQRNSDLIKAKKANVASANLKNIFETTFKLTSKIGFHEMSLRHLSTNSKISMGGLYSYLTKKEDIATMVLDIVELVSQENNNNAMAETNEFISLEMAIKHHLYSSTLLQPWFFFLYFETRSLSMENQAKSKQIEIDTINTFETIIQSGVDKGIFDVNSPYFVAQTILSVLQDWYLKPWKNKQKNMDLEQYSKYLFIMVKKLLLIT